MNRSPFKWYKRLILGFSFGFFLFVLIFIFIRILLADRLKEGWFPPSITYYSDTHTIYSQQNKSLQDILIWLKFLNFRLVKNKNNLSNYDYSLLNQEDCHDFFKNSENTFYDQCLIFRSTIGKEEGVFQIITFFEGFSTQTYRNDPPEPVDKIELPALKLYDRVQNTTIMREPLLLKDIPLSCLQAVTAIEDPHFLNHAGFSLKGILRAFFKNIKLGQFSQGGSTITQQLVKNYFLNSERTLIRKAKELVISVVLESAYNKDEILQAYLNIIYLGQNGPYEIRGYGSASHFYFEKPIQELTLNECSLLAALVNSPGLYSPFKHPDKLKARQQLVLDKMLQLNMITPEERTLTAVLPNRQNQIHAFSFPYYDQLIDRELLASPLSKADKSLSLYTSLDPWLQFQAQEQIKSYVKKLSLNPTYKDLQALLISVDVSSGKIKALVGGADFKQSQFNRALDSKRQVGSLFKPIVYLTALHQEKQWNPLSLIDDSPITIKNQDKLWTPQNYDKISHGSIPLFFALKNSYNISTVRLAQSLGLKNIIQSAHDLGFESPLLEVPSLSLGAIEASPLEILTVYLTLAREGQRIIPYGLKGVQITGHQEWLWTQDPRKIQSSFSQSAIRSLLSLLHTVTLSGTAQSLTSQEHFPPILMGKTGTTNGHRDSWFIGFSQDLLTLVWIGKDEKQGGRLTGATGALPLWSAFMKKALNSYPPREQISFMKDPQVQFISGETLKSLIPLGSPAKDWIPVSLYWNSKAPPQ